MKKYFVIATKWDEEKKARVKYIVGEFSKFYCAALFRDAYNNNFKANATIVEESDLLNK